MTRTRLGPVLLLALALPAGAAKITEFPTLTASSQPYAITSAFGDLWFTEVAANKIARMTPAGASSEFTIPRASSGPVGIAAGPNYTLYFTESSTGGIGRLYEFGTFQTEITGFTNPNQIVAGADGRMWFTESSASKLYALQTFSNTASSGEAATPTASASPIGVCVGADGYVYFTEDGAGKLGYVVPDGLIHETVNPIPTSGSHPRRCAADGVYVWFTENAANQIGRYDVHTGSYAEFPIPTASSAPLGITIGPDGNVWFTENSGNKIGRITEAGVITEYPVPTAGSHPVGICAGPDGNIWFTENAAGKIGRLDVFIPGDVNDDGAVGVNDVFYLINYLFGGGPAPK